MCTATRSEDVLGGISMEAPVRARIAKRISERLVFSASIVSCFPSQEITGACVTRGCAGDCSTSMARGGGAVVGAGVGLGADTTPSVVLRTIVFGGGCCCNRLSRDAWASADPRNSRPVSRIEPTAQFRQPVNRTLDLANLVQHTLHIPRGFLPTLALLGKPHVEHPGCCAKAKCLTSEYLSEARLTLCASANTRSENIC